MDSKTKHRAIVLLKKARDLIANKKRWCQGSLCKTKDDTWTWNVKGKEAAKWCALGAITKYSCDGSSVRNLAFESLRKFSPNISKVNDKDGHKAILELFSKGIKNLKESL